MKYLSFSINHELSVTALYSVNVLQIVLIPQFDSSLFINHWLNNSRPSDGGMLVAHSWFGDQAEGSLCRALSVEFVTWSGLMRVGVLTGWRDVTASFLLFQVPSPRGTAGKEKWLQCCYQPRVR